jgi:MraZ protein
LVGEYEFTLDAKNRVAIPARLRPAFSDGIYLTTWHERSLGGFAPEQFQQMLDERSGPGWSQSSKGRAERRFLTGQAVWQELDKQGRVTLPARLLEYASIEREVTVIGVDDHIELWNRAAWMAYRKTIEEGADATADELAAS